MWIWVLWVVGALGVTSTKAQGALESPELAWLLANEAPPPPLSLRRITPKSVFLAPTFTCSDGYRQDSQGRCVKVVKINQQAQWDFFLKKLNSMYAAPPPREKQPTGPIRLPIPFETDTTTTLNPTTTTEEGTTSSPSTISPSTAPPTTTTTEQAAATETTPLVIVVANSTEITTDRDWMSTSVPAELLGKTTELSTPMTTTSATDCEDCFATSNYQPYQYSAPIDYFTPTTRAPELRPTSSRRPPAAPDIQGYPPALPPSPRPAVYQHRPTEGSFFPQPTPPSSETHVRHEFATRRTTVRFPSERPPVASQQGLQFIRFPASQLPFEQSPIWWPPAWDQSQWPQRQSKPWGHREPRPSWTHQ